MITLFINFQTIFEPQLLKTNKLIIMKKLLLILSIVAFTNLSYAQVGSLKDATKTTESVTKTAESATKANSKEVQKQIQNGLVTNEAVGAMGADYLKSNPDTKSAFLRLYKENNGSIGKTMKAAMKDPEMKKSVMDYINDNPDVMNKALSMLGM